MTHDSRAAASAMLRSPWPWLLAFLLLDPLAFSGQSADRPDAIGLCLPRVHCGDEPHYLVMLNSLIGDGDLDLANNYAGVHRGELDAGRSASGHDLDHHVKWYKGDRLLAWYDVFIMPHGAWRQDSDGHPMPTLRPGAAAADAPAHEYSWHPAGLPLLVAPLVWPLAGSRWVEPAALACSGLATVAAMLLYRWLIGPYAQSEESAWLATAATFLCTPAWHYGRTFFCEPYLLALVVAAYAFVLRASWHGAAGLCMALAALMKPPIGLLAIPLVANAWWPSGAQRVRLFTRAARVAWLILPIAAALAILEVLNRQMFGGWFRSPIRWESSFFADGVLGLLFSLRHGLLANAPITALAVAAWPAFLRAHQRDAQVLAMGSFGWFCLMSAWVAWHGGACYGPRMVVPVIPLFLAAMPVIPACRWWRHRWARGAVAALGVVSLVINAVAAFCPSYAWRMHPLRALAALAGY